MSTSVVSLLIAAAVVSMVHGLLPNHWLPFVLIGRAQSWNARRMLWVLAAAGAAHAAVSGAIAMVTLLLGVAVAGWIEPWADKLPAFILLAAGALYVLLDLLSGHGSHHHDIHEAADHGMSDKTAVATLVLTLALSPCEAMVPVFVSAAPTGDPVLLLALVVVSGATSLAVMSLLAMLAWRGSGHLRFGRLAHHERLVIGTLLLGMGLLVLGLGGL